ncbi:putative transcription factor bHLH family [Helianthus annuus]|uniref:Transcription factor bHLH family n=2 Tax=Helianthus annuus TaxID=4232 RepID=A0A9K3N6T0_HELAN|nr:transcription factor IBH1-like 1 [Helianthus annuus]KAF5789456.1 putative transcription factor bHLH family [Helianthus annuus]KAJ0524833.1 putative transcription factor bHLH family [Helianthus annuus]KAJ0532775.1 putative transcription factor bHLH family [Helianthus annuus]KAJ0541183.1 putative transcription factor bHLH family [Helianthus annuus]KAJ0706265.1 putative transcription factor bHLH family [Helianthus annuus]
MHTSSKLTKEFTKKWVKGLQICCSSKKDMDVLERKKKIKLCADIALASAKNATTSWSIALISEAKKNDENEILVDNLLGPESRFKQQKIIRQMNSCHKRVRSKKILKKSCSISQRMKKMGPPKSNLAAYIAKRLVKKRTQVLQRLVPGGESMDEFSLIKEALDYILSLRVQVDVMRNLANATEVLNQSNSSNVFD